MGYVLSIRSLKRITKKIGLHRRKYMTDILQVALFVLEQCEMHGYRWMHLKCVETEPVVNQETVRVLLHIIDPKGIELRRGDSEDKFIPLKA